MSEEEIKQIWDNLFNKLNETERTYLAIISNEKNKQITKLKSQLQQKENIIKEVREKVNRYPEFNYSNDYMIFRNEIKEILDKMEKGD